VAVGAVRRDTGTPIWSATFGGVSMTLDYTGPYVGDDQLMAFSLVEASIPSGLSTFTVTASGGTALDPFHGVIYTLGGRNQSTALDSGFSSNGTATAAASVTTASISNAAHSCLLAAVRDSTGDTITSPSGWTRRRSDSTTGVIAFDDFDDAASSAGQTFQWTAVTASWMYITLAYQAASATSAKLLTMLSNQGGF